MDKDCVADSVAIPDALSETSAEATAVGRELAAAYKRLADHYRDGWGLTAAEADTRARGADGGDDGRAADRARTLARPADEVSWWELSHLAEHDPDTLTMMWDRIKAEARAELATGHRTAAALEWHGSPWDRARFLALRAAFTADVVPRGAVEVALVDALAQSFDAYLRWTERCTTRAESEGRTEDARLSREGSWQPPRVSVDAAIEQAATFAERAHKRFLLTLRALHDARRLPAAVVVTNAGQINVGGQQVNIASSPPRCERACAGAESPGKF